MVKPGLNSNLAFCVISIVNDANLPGRIVLGIVADKVGPFNVIVAVVVASGLVATCWIKAIIIPGIVVFSLAYGSCFEGEFKFQDRL